MRPEASVCVCIIRSMDQSKSSQSGVSTGRLKDVDRGASVTRHSEESGCVCQTNIDRAALIIHCKSPFSLFTHFCQATTSHAYLFRVCILNCLRRANLPVHAHAFLLTYVTSLGKVKPILQLLSAVLDAPLFYLLTRTWDLTSSSKPLSLCR